MSRRFLGLLLFAVGLAALVAGFQVVALVSAATGLLFIASTARPGRVGSDRGGSVHAGSAGSSDSYYYGDHRNDDDRVGGSDGDSGGGGDGEGGGDGGGGGGGGD